MKYTIHTSCRTMSSDLETPVGIYMKIRDLFPESALLESSDYHAVEGSTSIIGVEPIGRFVVSDSTVTASYPDDTSISTEIGPDNDVIDMLSKYLRSYSIEGPGARLTNGLLGFTAYDAVRYFDSINIQPRESKFKEIPDIAYILYRFLIIVDHYRNEMTIIENRQSESTPSGIDNLIAVLRNHCVTQFGFTPANDIESPLTDAQYMEIVSQGIAHARRGDIFQVVLSRRFSQGFTGDDFNVYRALRCVNPSPYLFYFDFGHFRVFGSSPETHLRVTGNTAYIDPIAGTFRRTGDDQRDRQLAEALLEDAKENAEHMMLVDLARNDLARGDGKVSIEFLRHIQFYSHVIHMVSRVKAVLPNKADPYRLFAGTFPAGTLSGAPKIRAMQIIDELEPHSRVSYGGCIGYLGFNGDINQAITIRSFLSHGNRLYFQADAGIVSRSVPATELQETTNKLGALTRAITYATGFGC